MVEIPLRGIVNPTDVDDGDLGIGELVGCTFAEYPNLRRWYANVTAQPGWQQVNAPFQGFAASIAKTNLVELS